MEGSRETGQYISGLMSSTSSTNSDCRLYETDVYCRDPVASLQASVRNATRGGGSLGENPLEASFLAAKTEGEGAMSLDHINPRSFRRLNLDVSHLAWVQYTSIYPRQCAYVHPAERDQFCSGHLCWDLCQHQGLDRKASAKVLGNYKSLGGLTGKIYRKPFFNQYFWFAIGILLVVMCTPISDISDTRIVGDRSLETS